jgi:hypothetical protein
VRWSELTPSQPGARHLAHNTACTMATAAALPAAAASRVHRRGAPAPTTKTRAPRSTRESRSARRGTSIVAAASFSGADNPAAAAGAAAAGASLAPLPLPLGLELSGTGANRIADVSGTASFGIAMPNLRPLKEQNGSLLGAMYLGSALILSGVAGTLIHSTVQAGKVGNSETRPQPTTSYDVTSIFTGRAGATALRCM